jgi:hypothetical protein
MKIVLPKKPRCQTKVDHIFFAYETAEPIAMTASRHHLSPLKALFTGGLVHGTVDIGERQAQQ